LSLGEWSSLGELCLLEVLGYLAHELEGMTSPRLIVFCGVRVFELDLRAFRTGFSVSSDFSCVAGFLRFKEEVERVEVAVVGYLFMEMLYCR